MGIVGSLLRIGKKKPIDSVDQLVEQLIRERSHSVFFIVDEKFFEPNELGEPGTVELGVKLKFLVDVDGSRQEIIYNRNFGYIPEDFKREMMDNFEAVPIHDWVTLFYAQSVLALYEFMHEVRSRTAENTGVAAYIKADVVKGVEERIAKAREIRAGYEEKGMYIPVNQPLDDPDVIVVAEREMTVDSLVKGHKEIIKPWEGEFTIIFPLKDYWEKEIWIEDGKLNLGVVGKVEMKAPSGRVVHIRPRWHFGYIEGNPESEWRKIEQPHMKRIWDKIFSAKGYLLMMREAERARIEWGDKDQSVFVTDKDDIVAVQDFLESAAHRYTAIE